MGFFHFQPLPAKRRHDADAGPRSHRLSRLQRPRPGGNIPGANLFDTVRHCRQMITWGELVKAEPLWDSEPDLWVALREPPAA
uniref:Uncharacterized protein n=1 Tax=Rhodococcus sp. NS1 TaxID=402236 RepID=Q06GI0_9NOCA|nr:hypothetical protein PNSL1.003 [Rhodococcus sp. NS1]